MTTKEIMLAAATRRAFSLGARFPQQPATDAASAMYDAENRHDVVAFAVPIDHDIERDNANADVEADSGTGWAEAGVICDVAAPTGLESKQMISLMESGRIGIPTDLKLTAASSPARFSVIKNHGTAI